MRPEQQTTSLENPHMHLAILMQTTILTIINVVIMMRMTCASLCNFY